MGGHPHPESADQLVHDAAAVKLLQEVEELHEELSLLRTELDHAHALAMLGTLAAGIAHEFNNILTPALNALERAIRHGGSGASPSMSQARDAILKSTRISQAILELGRGSASEFHVEQSGAGTVCDLSVTIDQAVLCVSSQAKRAGVQITVDTATGTSACIDQIALEQVLVNLILNAIHAMPQGGVIRISVRDDSPSHLARIEVADEGIGIPRERLVQIFESFVSFDPHGATKGHGLGLMVCRRLVENAGGSIHVESAVGVGTTFRIDLPRPEDARLRHSA